MNNKISFCLILFINVLLSTAEGLTVEESYVGLKKTFMEKELDVFLGIPYAKPPLGELRFKKPVPYVSDGKVREAKEWPDNCHQGRFLTTMEPKHYFSMNNRNVSEDCLYLNVWSPKKSRYALKPVMVWIHGGALLFGSSNQDLFDSEALAALGDVVVVTINYRLQAMGFLYTGTDDAPGNVGLWDQVMALQWVRDNIEHFGGDPNQVTIFGDSAGGWSVTLHLLSPISRGLFTNAIFMSGSALNHVIGRPSQDVLKLWLNIAHLSGCGNGEKFTEESIECLRKIPAQTLTDFGDPVELAVGLQGFLPTVRYGDEFLPKKPIQMLAEMDFKKNTSILSSFTDDEGLLFWVEPKLFHSEQPIDLTKAKAIELMKIFSARIESDIPVNADDVVRVYLSDVPEDDSKQLMYRLNSAFGDFYLGCSPKLFAKAIYSGEETNNRVFQQYFKVDAKPKQTKGWCVEEWNGFCHYLDLTYVFGLPFRYPNDYSSDEKTLSQRVIKAFSHFAKHNSLPPQNGIEWQSFYTLNGHIVEPHYEWSLAPNGGKFKNSLKETECEKLWEFYIKSL